VIGIVQGIGQVGVGHLRSNDTGSSHFCHSWSLLDRNSWSLCNTSWGSILHDVDRQVGGGHPEAERIGDVVDGLDDTVGIHIAVGTSHHTVGCLHLCLGLVRALVAIVVLTQFILANQENNFETVFRKMDSSTVQQMQ
jgi:hypothetical protein